MTTFERDADLAPRVSIIIPTYNGSYYISETIASVIAQTLDDWELIIIDDGSSDETVAMVSGFAASDSRIRVFRQQNLGVAATRNRGLELANPNTASIMFLDHDDLLAPTALADLAQQLDAQPDAVAVQGEFAVIDSHSQPIARQDFVPPIRRRRLVGWRYVDCQDQESTSLAVIIASDCILTPGQVLIRRSSIDMSSGLFPSRFDTYDDWMAWINISQHGAIAYLPKVVLHYRQHEQNQSRNVKKLFRGRRAIFREIIRSPQLHAMDRRTACIAWIYIELADGASKLRYAGSMLTKFNPIEAFKQFARMSICLTNAAHALASYAAIRFSPAQLHFADRNNGAR